MFEVKLTTEQAKSLENSIYFHMEMCQNEAMGEDVPEDWEPYAPYCGCQTCETREYLLSIFEWFKQNGIIDVYIEDGDTNEDTLF